MPGPVLFGLHQTLQYHFVIRTLHNEALLSHMAI